LKAIGAAKTAMLIEIANGIDKLKKSGNADSICQYFDEKSTMVTPSYAIFCFMGYVFRVTIKADREIQIIQHLQNPNIDAWRLLQTLTKQSIIAARHHSMAHGVYTSHPSSSATVRLAKRWLSSHLLGSDGCIPLEVVELTVIHVYTNPSILEAAPATITSGFLRWLHFISSYNWLKRPMIVDPQGHLNDADHYSILEQFEDDRGELYRNGPAWYIVSPYDRLVQASNVDDDDAADDENNGGVFVAKSTTNTFRRIWTPTYTSTYPERVVASRIVALAQRTYAFLQNAVMTLDGNHDSSAAWPGAFQESHDAFRSYSVLLRVDPSFMVNADASSSAPISSLTVQKIGPIEVNSKDTYYYESTYTRSMCSLAYGPKDLRKKMYRNLILSGEGNDDETKGKLLTEWQPIRNMIQVIRSKLGHLLLIFCNDLCPEVMGIVWRQPIVFQSRSFSAFTSEYARPVTTEQWQSDTMVSYNVHDLLRTIALYTRCIITDMKVFDYGSHRSTAPALVPSRTLDSPVKMSSKRQRERKPTKSSESDNTDDDSSTT
jgi:U3 small nucleolar RNA-associated protein 22